jgi:hypothetical protein
MFTRRLFVTTFGALLGLSLGVATLAAAGGTIEYFTFSAPVSLPGVSLGSGRYSFEILDLSSSSVVSIRNGATRLPVFLGLTQRVDRPAGHGTSQSVVLGESSRGVAPPIVVWYPEGGAYGHQFIYPRR